MAILILGACAQYETIVDDDLYPILARYRWTFKISSKKYNYAIYGRRCTRVKGVKVTILLSHEILRLRGKPRPSKRHSADHRNGNTLDDRSDNLRWATKKQQSNNPTERRVSSGRLLVPQAAGS